MACVYVPTRALGFIKILLIWFFFSCVCAVVTFLFSRQHIIDNWSEYKCSPLVTPFASAFGQDPTETLHECLSVNYTALSSQLHSPFVRMYKKYSDSLESIGAMNGELNYMSSGIGVSLGARLKKFLGQLGNVGSAVHYLIIKMETLLHRLVAACAVIMFSMSSMMNGILALKNDTGLQSTIEKLMDPSVF